MALLSAQHPDVAVKFRQRLEESFVDDNPAVSGPPAYPLALLPTRRLTAMKKLRISVILGFGTW